MPDALDVDTEVLDGFSEPDDACVNYEECENEVPAAGEMCGPCLDTVRGQGRGTGNVSETE